MIKAENIIIKEKYKGLKNLVLICDAMDEFAKQYHKEQLTLTDVVPSVYVVTETDNYGRQLFRDVFLDKEQAKEYLAMDNLKEDNINEINKIEFD